MYYIYKYIKFIKNDLIFKIISINQRNHLHSILKVYQKY